MRRRAAVLAAAAFVALLPGAARATVCNMTLLTDNAPDYTDMQSLIWSATSNFSTDKEKVLRLFRWAAQGRRQTEPGPEHGYEVRDPILFYNSYGNTLCSLISGMNIQVWQNMGYDGCRWDTSAHSLSQVYYGGAWHWLDNSLTAYFWNDSGEIASIAEVSEDNDPTLHICLSQYGPEVGSCYDGWAWCSDSPTQRTLRHFGDTYAKNAYIVEYHTEGEWGHRYTLNLRQFEHYTRYWAPFQPRTIDVYRPNNSGNDPDSQWSLYNIVGNGRWIAAPDLTTNDYRKVIFDETNIESFADSALTPNLHPDAVDTTASVIFKIYGANVVCSADVDFTLQRADGGDTARILVSTNNGMQWTEVYNHTGTGSVSDTVHLQAEIGGTLEYLVKVELYADGAKTDAGLDAISIDTVTQVNKRTLAPLTLGTNRVQLFFGEQYESILMWPDLRDGEYQKDIVDEAYIYADASHPGWNAVLGVGDHNVDCYITYRLDAPTDIAKVTYGGRFYNRGAAGGINSHCEMLHSFDGAAFTEDWNITEVDMPWDDKGFVDLDGGAIPASTRSMWFKYNFWQNYGVGAPDAYADTGAYSVLMRVHHTPRDATFVPIEVTYNWTEHIAPGNDVTREHTQLVDNPAGMEWVINTAGYKDPTMNWVRVCLQGQGPNGAGQTFGYSDSTDVGTGYERALKKYTWGTNLAQGKTYTSSVASGSFNPDTGGAELTDGVIGGQAIGSYSPAIVPGLAIWDNDAEPEFTVDLESVQSVKGFRLWTGANSYGWGMVHPDHIDIEVSTDDVTYTPVATIDHDQLWDPPGDYIPWEHDDSATEDAVPHKGRVLYGFYHVLDTPVNARYVRFKTFVPANCKLSFWELQVYDSVVIEDWDNGLALRNDLPGYVDNTPPVVNVTACDLTGTVDDETTVPSVVTVGGVDVAVSAGTWTRTDVPVSSGTPITISATDGVNTTTLEVMVTY